MFLCMFASIKKTSQVNKELFHTAKSNLKEEMPIVSCICNIPYSMVDLLYIRVHFLCASSHHYIMIILFLGQSVPIPVWSEIPIPKHLLEPILHIPLL